jgi:hypothetical protein
MAIPVVTNVTPTSVNLKQGTDLTIHGDNFAGNDLGECTVDLGGSNGYYWNPPQITGRVVSSHTITAHSTPHGQDDEESGTGDLTTTVTNGDGSGTSVPQTQEETYVSG